MRIGIIGAGAIGSVVGGLLTKAGHDVTLVDQWPEHVEKMRSQGLKLSGTCGDHLIRVNAIHIHEMQRIAEPFEAAFVAVKSYDTEWATALAIQYLRQPDGVVVDLSGTEFRLLRTFVDHPNRTLSRDQLIELMLDRDAGPFDRAIDVQVSRLRHRLRDNAKEPELIKTVRGHGYVLAAHVETVA